MEGDSIKFYRVGDDYGVFSNFYASPITMDGVKYPTTEHYYQAKKFEGQPLEADVVNCKSPGDAFRLANANTKQRRKDWFAVSLKVMETALYHKFTQHEDLKQKLLDTGNRKIIEHTTKDNFFGDGGDGSGQNHLGRLLMELRAKLRNQQ